MIQKFKPKKGKTMKEDKEIEQILLNDEKYEKFINEKAEQEFNKILEDVSKTNASEIKDFKKVPKELLFSKKAVYLVINKSSKTKSYVNGLQAEGFLGDKNLLREKLTGGFTDSFVSGDNFVKFYKLEA